jgi:CheY-like chemotaxis protein
MAMDVLGQAQDDRALLAEMSSIIQRQSSHLTRLIDDLLDVSRITRGNVEIRIGRVDLCLIIKHAIDGARQMCEAKGLNLSVTLPAQKIMIDADPVRFTQVISNLLNNACKFTDHGGAVYVTARQEGDEGIISVRDTGIGIAPPELPRIFDMFVQLGDQRSRAAGGLGIGLSLARSIIEMHGGTIEATSQGPGRGTEFIVRVPAVEPDEETVVDDADRGADAQSKRRVRRRRILVVDDNDDALESVASLLRLAGHEVLTAGSGRQALEKAQSNRPEIILLDIGMPEMDGYEVVRRIRSQPWGQHIFIVALTGWGQKKDKQHAIEAGFNAHLTKPADAESIERLLMEQSMVASLRRQDPCLH